MRFALVISFFAALALAISVSADHCTTYTTHTPDATTCAVPGSEDVLPPCLYVAEENCQPECGPFSLWLYEESNGIAGLQRGDEVVDNTCHGMIQADTIIF